MCQETWSYASSVVLRLVVLRLGSPFALKTIRLTHQGRDSYLTILYTTKPPVLRPNAEMITLLYSIQPTSCLTPRRRDDCLTIFYTTHLLSYASSAVLFLFSWLHTAVLRLLCCLLSCASSAVLCYYHVLCTKVGVCARASTRRQERRGHSFATFAAGQRTDIDLQHSSWAFGYVCASMHSSTEGCGHSCATFASRRGAYICNICPGLLCSHPHTSKSPQQMLQVNVHTSFEF